LFNLFNEDYFLYFLFCLLIFQFSFPNSVCTSIFICLNKSPIGALPLLFNVKKLHVSEELWVALDLTASNESIDVQSENLTAEDSVCALQLPQSDRSVRRNTLKLLAHIGKHQVMVLVNSGSVGTFISDKLVSTLSLPIEPYQIATFKATDGGKM
jgi:hypothetical protein